ncbi:MAG: hypothetical protein FWE40_08595 [Oscillospiraceae bacterium]|nr:hypothetical protein [Oscillospiraceae bacterium]
MSYYRNLGSNSSVVAYEYGADFIRIQFETGNPYTYSYSGGAGRNNVERMKQLADYGQGLGGYVQRHVRDLYDR